MIDKQESPEPQNVTRRRFIKRSGEATVGTAIGLYALQSPAWAQEPDDSSVFGMLCDEPNIDIHTKPSAVKQVGTAQVILGILMETRKKDPPDTEPYDNDAPDFKFAAVANVQGAGGPTYVHPGAEEDKPERSFEVWVENPLTGLIKSKEPKIGGEEVPETKHFTDDTILTIGELQWYLDIETFLETIGQNAVRVKARAVLIATDQINENVEGPWLSVRVHYNPQKK